MSKIAPTYWSHLGAVAVAMLTRWRGLGSQLDATLKAFREFAKELLVLLLVIAMPFLLPLAPLIAWWSLVEHERQLIKAREAQRKVFDAYANNHPPHDKETV